MDWAQSPVFSSHSFLRLQPHPLCHSSLPAQPQLLWGCPGLIWKGWGHWDFLPGSCGPINFNRRAREGLGVLALEWSQLPHSGDRPLDLLGDCDTF